MPPSPGSVPRSSRSVIAAVAVAVAVALAPSPSWAGPAAPAEELGLATLNTWGLPSPLATDRRGRLPRIATWLDARGFDIVGLQEVWHGAVSLLPTRGLLAPDGRDSGLALVTRHEVREATLHAYEAERGIDAWKAKGALVASLVVDDGAPLTVAVTHLQAGGGGRNAAVRAAQVDELLAALPDDGAPTVLLGDFNLYDGADTDARTHARLEAAGFVDVAAQAGATEGTYPGRSDRFDRIYARDGAERSLRTRSALVVADRDGVLSDHRAVEARLVSGASADGDAR